MSHTLDCSLDVNCGDSQPDSQPESEEIITPFPKPTRRKNVFRVTLKDLFALVGHVYDEDAKGADGVTPAKIRDMCRKAGIEIYSYHTLFMLATDPVTVQRANLSLDSTVGEALEALYTFLGGNVSAGDLAIRMDQLFKLLREDHDDKEFDEEESRMGVRLCGSRCGGVERCRAPASKCSYAKHAALTQKSKRVRFHPYADE
jgi:hypothetical protein